MLLRWIRIPGPNFPAAPRLAAIVARHRRLARAHLVTLGIVVVGLVGLGFLV